MLQALVKAYTPAGENFDATSVITFYFTSNLNSFSYTSEVYLS
jgi:hypothetical protein